ncbi:hypothetical protein LSAT2_006561 [Lamellibrachia satsuma]|nr:hypothetical protein LSAT2_006561 [Lamellibrachia satsuma]
MEAGRADNLARMEAERLLKRQEAVMQRGRKKRTRPQLMTQTEGENDVERKQYETTHDYHQRSGDIVWVSIETGRWLSAVGLAQVVVGCRSSPGGCRLSVLPKLLWVVGLAQVVVGCRSSTGGCRLSVLPKLLSVVGLAQVVVGCRSSPGGCRLSV